MKHLLFFSLALTFCAAIALADSGRVTISNETGESVTVVEDVDAAAYKLQAKNGQSWDLGNTATTVTSAPTSNSQPISKSFLVKFPGVTIGNVKSKRVNLQVKLEGSRLKYEIDGKMYDTLTPISDDYKSYEMHKVGDLFVYVRTYQEPYHKGYHDINFYITNKEIPRDALER